MREMTSVSQASGSMPFIRCRLPGIGSSSGPGRGVGSRALARYCPSLTGHRWCSSAAPPAESEHNGARRPANSSSGPGAGRGRCPGHASTRRAAASISRSGQKGDALAVDRGSPVRSRTAGRSGRGHLGRRRGGDRTDFIELGAQHATSAGAVPWLRTPACCKASRSWNRHRHDRPCGRASGAPSRQGGARRPSLRRTHGDINS